MHSKEGRIMHSLQLNKSLILQDDEQNFVPMSLFGTVWYQKPPKYS